jgi:hypothetical protein
MINHELSMPDYLAINALSSGAAFRAVTQSPLHARHYQLTNSKNSSVADIGTIAHRILLEGHENDIVLIDADDWRTKDAKAARDTAYLEGKTPLLAKEIPHIRAMVDSARAFIDTSEIADIWESGNPEVTVDWEEKGVLCKARPDFLSADWHVSVKTTRASAAPASWARRMLSPMGYDVGLMFYRRGLLANGIDVNHRILVIEQTEPYGCSLIALEPNKAAIANALIDQAIKIWAECQKMGVYPGYSRETFFAEATPWELAEAEAREYEELK